MDGLPIESTYEFATTMRSEILSRTEPSQESMLLSRSICDSGETLDSMGLNPTVCLAAAIVNGGLILGRSTIPKCPPYCPGPSTCISWNWSPSRSTTWLETYTPRPTQTVNLKAVKLTSTAFGLKIRYRYPQPAMSVLVATHEVS